jgi:TupA-like ATPgrasp
VLKQPDRERRGGLARTPDARAPLPKRLLRHWRKLRMKLIGRWQRLRGFPHLHARFRAHHGYDLNLRAPRTFNEKVQYRKVFDRNPLFPIVSDKFRLRRHVARVLGPEDAANLFPKLLGVTRRPTRRWLERLGTGIALKANNASARNIFLRRGEPVDTGQVLRTCRKWLRQDYGRKLQEWGYWPIPRRIVAEELLVGRDGRLADDIKFFMFGGVCGLIDVEWDRFGRHAQVFLDSNWNRLPVQMKQEHWIEAPPRPPMLADMLDVAARLGAEFDHVRVDFLYTGDRYALNELTLYSGSGINPFRPVEWDRKLGDLWQQRVHRRGRNG